MVLAEAGARFVYHSPVFPAIGTTDDFLAIAQQRRDALAAAVQRCRAAN